jgi:LacI family transcriptional regulator
LATILDVARLAGVSVGTVSRVTNGVTGVRPQTRESVLRAIADLGYVPSSHARGLRGKPSSTVALIISDVANPFYASLTRGVEDVAQSHGYSLVLCNADRGRTKQRQYVERLLAEGVRGMVIAPARNTITDLRALAKRGVALVVVDWRHSLHGVDNVYTDSVAGARETVAHFLSLGHSRIAAISGPHDDATAEDRVTGYHQALAEAGVAANPALVRFGSYTEEAGFRHCLALLRLAPPPTAVFTANNRLAAGAYRAIESLGLRVPEDVSLGSFDTHYPSGLLAPLTAFAQPEYDMGRTAAELLLERLGGLRRDNVDRQVVLQGRLIVGGSSAPPGGLRRP